MKISSYLLLVAGLVLVTVGHPAADGQGKDNPPAAVSEGGNNPPRRPLHVDPPHISADKTIKYDYDIVYVRAPRVVPGKDGREQPAPVWPNAAEPANLRASTDLMRLRPDGSEEVLVAGGKGAIADPYVSFDAQWVYYSYFHDLSGRGGADVYKVHVPTRKTVRLTQQVWTPNTGCVAGKAQPPKGVYNMHPCPLPGGRVAFISDRDGLKAPRGAQRALQLFVMDDDGANVEKIGYLNVGQALHPVVLKDGRLLFSSLEMQGQHNTGWGVWSIHPDGTNWNPVVSALGFGGAAIPFHFQTQLSDESIVVENYYVPAMGGFGMYFRQPARPPEGTPPFGPAKAPADPKMAMMRSLFRMPFQPYGMEVVTRFTHNHDSPALRADPKDPKSPHTGWVTHPCGAPDNHLLTVWSGMMPADQGRITDDKRPVDAGIYLIKGGRPLWEPGQMRLIKNDPKYNEQWPRPLVPYRRLYGVPEPKRLPALANDGNLSRHLPEGTPFGLVGASSLYKRESFPLGVVPKGSVTATGSPYGTFPTRDHRTNWDGQGADAGLYANSDIHAVRILVMEPASLPVAGKFLNAAGERLRILGEIPVRKFVGGEQPLDPDGNPDTSFLAKIPADVAWTFQTLDRSGMVLNMAQTWHQLRPGEIRNDCGGCHAHSQKPTPFRDTFAARPDYPIFDLTRSTPLLTTKQHDQSGQKWDVRDETGLKFARGVLNVEYYRDIVPLFERSCVACHTGKSARPAGNLVLDDHTVNARTGQGPATYHTLLHPRSSKSQRYVWPFQSRNSPLTWKVFGKRTDGFPERVAPGTESDYQGYLNRGGVPFQPFKGSIMPPPEAVAGTCVGPDGQKVKVAPLTAEDRLTLVRWIDLGCPIDKDFDPRDPQKPGRGWMLDDQRPTLTLTYPKAGVNKSVARFLVGMYDYGTGLDLDSFTVVANFPVGGAAAGQNLANKFRALPGSRWELTLSRPIQELPEGRLTVSVRDRQGNLTKIERTFSVRD
jgi:Hydrazine synthase alpha subunit middle domain